MAFLDRIQNEIEELNGLFYCFSLFFMHYISLAPKKLTKHQGPVVQNLLQC